MSYCKCEPHASGSNRCDICRYEAARARDEGTISNRLGLAIEFIRALAFGAADSDSTRARAAEWLDANGFDGPLKARRDLERRTADLDKQIAKLQEERARLTGEGSPCG